jgi:uncharacterized protein YhaN
VKILDLRLTAFGPFTHRLLDFSSGNLHVLFGPNEAGKSSALRALHAALYGIPGQTSDGFLHPYDTLRVGGRLRHSDGTEITFIRRKGNKNTLLAPEGGKLDDHALDRFLGGESAEKFRTFWGIDHARLVEGGREILEGRGDLGESLFAAGSGVSHLGVLRKRLKEEADRLFVPRGQNPPINKAIHHLRELRSEQQKVSLSANTWEGLAQAVQDAGAQVKTLTARDQELKREASRLKRIKRVLPLLAEREAVRRRLGDLGEVVPLAPDFPKRRQDAEMALRTARGNFDRVTDEIQKQEKTIETLGTTPSLVALADAVNDLYKNIGGHRKALSDRSKLILQCSEQRALAARYLGGFDLGIETAETLRPFVKRRARIQNLVTQRAQLDERVASAGKRQGDAQEQAQTLAREALPPPRDAGRLMIVIKEAQRKGDAEAAREKAVQSIQQTLTQCTATIEKLGLPASAMDRVQALRVPTEATLARFEQEDQARDGEARAAKTERQRLTRAKRETDAKIEQIQTQKAIPTEADLVKARKRRDDAFGLLRAQWEEQRDVAAETDALLGAGQLILLYPTAVEAADGVADRLRNEAERVAEFAKYRDERDRLIKALEEVEADSQRREEALQKRDAAWRDVWKPVLADPPKIHDARAWHTDFERLTEQSKAVMETQQGQQTLDRWIEEQAGNLRDTLIALASDPPPTGCLAVMLEVAERLRQQIEQEARKRTEHLRKTGDTEQAIRDAKIALDKAQAEIEAWQNPWDEATRGLVPGNALPPPDEALGRLDEIEKIFRAFDEAAGYEKRIAGIDRDAESFQADVQSLAGRLGEGAIQEGGSEDTWVEEIHRRLTSVLKEEERRQQACTRLERLRSEVTGHQEAIATACLTLSSLRQEAWCGADSDLVIAEQRSADFGGCQHELKQIGKNLIVNGDGASIADLETETAGADKDTLDVRLEQIEMEGRELETRLSAARDAQAIAQAQRASLQGPSVASEKAETIQETLAKLRDDILHCARLRVASTLLSQRIDDYRRKNQTPLLLRAGALFREMTCHRFERLETDLEEEVPILMGIRPDGRSVRVEGMSEGTRDQLFLALRLAAVEASCETGEPIPFIVDDILVQFDDDRTAAALRALADVASRTQVILFTHHQEVKRHAESLTAPAGVVVHELS